MRVRFLERFDWNPPERGNRTTIAHQAGWTGTVRRACGEAAVAAGKARELKDARRRPAA